MKVSIPCAAALALYPLVSALPAPTAAPGQLDIIRYGLELRGLVPRQAASTPGLPSLDITDGPASTSRTPAAPSSTSSAPPPPSTSSTPPSPSSQPPAQSPTSTQQAAETSARPSLVQTSTSQTKIESTQGDGSVVTITSQVIITSDAPIASASPSKAPDDGGSSGPSTSTIIGLSVAGGLAALVAIAFIVWKLTSKRFSQFDNDDAAINWPDLQKEPEVAPARPAPSVRGASTTSSSVDLKDPYAVPPLPQNNSGLGLGPYRDDASGFYDPYRGPIPQTFATPPASTDGHPQGWAGGEAIPMSTYTSGRSSPGPNLAYGDPYANTARSTSPGPNLAYGAGVDPMQRTATPVQRIGTPVQRIGTPGGGAATFQEIVRTGTPGGGAVPYRTGTPGYGYGGR